MPSCTSPLPASDPSSSRSPWIWLALARNGCKRNWLKTRDYGSPGLGFGWLAFGVGCQGNLALLLGIILLGGFTFAGIGLLVASRAKTVETVSGLMNLVMLPMWILSGVFFSYERFPEAVHPLLRLLPLTALNDALRGVMLDGQSAWQLWPELATLAVWGSITFVIALRIFRWR